MSLRWSGALAALLVCLSSAVPLQGQEPGDSGGRVWVNLRSGVYHCAGTEHYGKTRRGVYLAESEARHRGFQPKGGAPCRRAARAGAAASLPRGGPAPSAEYAEACVVTRVVDADTIRCAGLRASVRLIGIDAPEDEQQPQGDAATAALEALVTPGTTLQLERDRDPRDRYGRNLAYAWLDGVLLNWVLVRQGYAVSVRVAPNFRHAEALEAAEREARTERAGLWGTGGFDCRPADHRRRAC